MDDQAIREVHNTWIAAVNAGDLPRLQALMTDDAVFFGSGQEPAGKDEFAANFAAAQEEMQCACDSELEEVVIAGDVAYARSRDHLSVTLRAAGGTAHLAGHRMTIYRKQADGRWLLARDAHTLLSEAGA